MRNARSLLAEIFIFIFSFASFVSNIMIVKLPEGRFFYLFLASFIYVAPLLIDVLEDFSAMNERSYVHFVLDFLAIFWGIVYFMLLFFIGLAKAVPFDLNITVFNLNITLWDISLQMLAYLPGVFLLRNTYCIFLSTMQQWALARITWGKS